MDQAGRYIDVWPAWLDLENLIYRPVLGLLILLLRFAAGCWIALWISLSFSCAGVSTGTARCRMSFRRAMSLTVAAGKTANVFGWLGNHTWRRKHPVERDYVHVLAVRYEELKENNMVIG